MAFPPQIPPIDVGAVRAGAGQLAPLGPAIGDQGDRTVVAWRQVGTYYLAPETPALIAALDPIGPQTRTAGDRTAGTAQALTGWADRIEPVLAELRTLAAISGPPTPEQEARADALTAELAAAEQACVSALKALQTDFRPPPTRLSEQVDKASIGLTVGYFTIGRSAQFKQTQLSDGSVLLAVVDAGELGVKGDLGSLVSLGAGVKLENGSTWKFHDINEANALRQQLTAYVDQQRTVLYDDIGGAAAGVVFGGVAAPRPPDLVVTEFSTKANGDLKADAGLVDGKLGAEGTVKATRIQDMASGATTTILNREGSLTDQVSATPLGAGPSVAFGGKGTLGATTAVVTDPSGKVTKVILTSTDSVENSQGDKSKLAEPKGAFTDEHKSAQTRVTTTTLDVNDANRAAVQAWVDAGKPDGGLGADPALHYPDTVRPGDPFQNELHDHAKVTQVTFDDETDKGGVDAKVKAGWELGFEASVEETTTAPQDAEYLGAPGPDGVRHLQPLPH